MTKKHLLIPLSIAVLSASVCAGNLPLLQTGQTNSYDVNGKEVTDGSIKDDGYYRAGAARSYTRDNVNQIVTDNTTKLQWQDDGNASSITKNWADAQTYCTSLPLGGYSDWRLPSRKELLSIVDYSRAAAPAIDPTFKNTATYGYYWSSTTNAGSTGGAWIVYFGYGSSYYNDYGDNYKASYDYVRCVRGGQ